MTANRLVHFASLALLTASLTPLTWAQQGPSMRPEGPMSFRGGHDGGGMSGGGFHRGPGGMWWKNPEMATKLGLTADQQKKMEDIFLQSRVQLIHIKATLEEQELLLEPLMSANPVDSNKALAQIGKIADTRAELEKANAKMLLGIRGVLTPAQWTMMHDQEHRRGGGPGGMGGRDDKDGPGGMRGRRGPDGQRGPGGPGGNGTPAGAPKPPTPPPAVE